MDLIRESERTLNCDKALVLAETNTILVVFECILKSIPALKEPN